MKIKATSTGERHTLAGSSTQNKGSNVGPKAGCREWRWWGNGIQMGVGRTVAAREECEGRPQPLGFCKPTLWVGSCDMGKGMD